MKIKPRGKIYSLNEGYAAEFDEPLKNYLQSIKYPKVIPQIVFLYFIWVASLTKN